MRTWHDNESAPELLEGAGEPALEPVDAFESIDSVSVTLRILQERETAALCTDEFQEFWLPLSQVTEIDRDLLSGRVTYEVPTWLANNRGLI